MPAKTLAGRKSDGIHKDGIHKIAERAEELMAESIRRQVSEHVPEAVQALAALAQGECVGEMEKIQGAVVRQAARDILEIAGGRPETRDPRTNDPSHQVHIYVQKFSPGAQAHFEKVVGPSPHAAIDELMARGRGEVAPEPVRSSVSREYDVPSPLEVIDAEAEVVGTD